MLKVTGVDIAGQLDHLLQEGYLFPKLFRKLSIHHVGGHCPLDRDFSRSSTQGSFMFVCGLSACSWNPGVSA